MPEILWAEDHFDAVDDQDLITLADVPDNAINKTNSYGKTLLVYACEQGFVDGVKCLLSHPKIDPNQACRGKPNTTPMMTAIRKRNLEIIKLLLPLVSINDSMVETALEYGIDLQKLKNQLSPKLMLKKYQRDLHNGIQYFKPALNLLRPGLVSLINNQQFISKLSVLELVALQSIIDVLMYENKQLLVIDIYDVMRVLFLLDVIISGEFTNIKERAITTFQDELTMRNVLNILDDITKYLERTISNNSIFLSLREYCLDFIAVNSRSPIHISLYEKYVETDERLDKYFRTLFKRNAIRPISRHSFNNFSLSSLFGQRISCDVILSIDGKNVPCHKTVLSSKSLFFETMFNGDWNSKEQYGPEMLYIVKECYNIRDQIPKEHLLPTMTEAHKHDMKDLVQFCAAKIEIDEDNFFEMVNELEQYFDDPLFEDVAEKILDFGASNANNLFKWSNVRHLPNTVMFMITVRLNCGKPNLKSKPTRGFLSSFDDDIEPIRYGSSSIMFNQHTNSKRR